MNKDNNHKYKNRIKHNCSTSRFRRRPSSFHMQDPELVFEKIALKKGDKFLDLGCGAGYYSIYASKIVGESGNVYALDLSQDMVDEVCQEAALQGINNIHPVVSDIRQKINIQDNSMDVCLISTVLHTMDFSLMMIKLFAELRRVIKLNGKLVVIECKKQNTQFGPPIHMRLSPEQLENGLEGYGFKKVDYVDLGFNYMVIFTLN